MLYTQMDASETDASATRKKRVSTVITIARQEANHVVSQMWAELVTTTPQDAAIKLASVSMHGAILAGYGARVTTPNGDVTVKRVIGLAGDFLYWEMSSPVMIAGEYVNVIKPIYFSPLLHDMIDAACNGWDTCTVLTPTVEKPSSFAQVYGLLDSIAVNEDLDPLDLEDTPDELGELVGE